MAKSFQKLPSLFLILSIFLPLLTFTASKSNNFTRTLSPSSLGLRKEKLSHLHFYFHDTIAGRNPTAVTVAQAATTNTSSTFFGTVTMMDDPLTMRPEPGSELVGRAQGIYASASLSELGFLMVMNFVFTEGKYNGSTLSVLGRNTPLSIVREMPIVGGSGLFRFARGYAQARTHKIDFTTAIIEYNVYVFHY